MNQPTNRPPNFDRLAPIYRWLEWASFGPWLWWCRCAFLGELASCKRALILGDGDGRFTARLLATNPAVQVEAVDASPAMLLSLLRRAGKHSARVHTQLADLRSWQPTHYPVEQPYDLVVTHFVLDCLTTEEVRSLSATLRTAVSPSAKWVISEFAVPQGWFGKLVANSLIYALYRAFGFLTGLDIRHLPDHAAALRQSGFTRDNCHTWLCGLLVSELWSVGDSRGR